MILDILHKNENVCDWCGYIIFDGLMGEVVKPFRIFHSDCYYLNETEIQKDQTNIITNKYN